MSEGVIGHMHRCLAFFFAKSTSTHAYAYAQATEGTVKLAGSRETSAPMKKTERMRTLFICVHTDTFAFSILFHQWTIPMAISHRDVVFRDGRLRWDHDGRLSHVDAVRNPVDARNGKE